MWPALSLVLLIPSVTSPVSQKYQHTYSLNDKDSSQLKHSGMGSIMLSWSWIWAIIIKWKYLVLSSLRFILLIILEFVCFIDFYKKMKTYLLIGAILAIFSLPFSTQGKTFKNPLWLT